MNRGKILLITKLFFAVIITLLLSVSSDAADPNQLEEQRRIQQQQTIEQQRRQKQPDVRIQKERAAMEALELPVESPCFQINKISIGGKGVDNFLWLDDFLSNYHGRCVGREGINIIIKRLNNEFISRGYITSKVGVPEQDISKGSLRLALLPGAIRKVYFSEEYYGTWETAFPGVEGSVLNLRDLEQGLEQMKRLPYQDVELDIKPAETDSASDVIIKLARQKPYRLSLSLDNSGSRATGKLQATAGLSIDNPFGLNDMLYVSASKDAQKHESELGTSGKSMYYSIPYGYWTLTFQGNSYAYKQTVAGQVQKYKYSGKTRILDATLHRIVHRDRKSKTGLQIRVIKRKTKSFIDDTEIEVQRRNTTAAELGITHRRYFGRVQLDVLLAHREGMRWFNGQGDDDAAVSGIPQNRYKIQTLDIALSAPFTIEKIPFVYRAQFRAQQTKSRLYTSEQFSIGSRYTVRGFDGEQMLAAEKGWYLRNELSIPIFNTGQELYLALDHGRLYGPSAELLAGRNLTGSAIGLRGSYGGLYYDIFLGWPLHKPDNLKTAHTTFGFNIAYQY